MGPRGIVFCGLAGNSKLFFSLFLSFTKIFSYFYNMSFPKYFFFRRTSYSNPNLPGVLIRLQSPLSCVRTNYMYT